ncbi:3-oxoacyl-reductase [Hyaloraphidium curvatum]|nr:3-oxoacyl-reductase [Hyaloraphidium curvatum]
MSSPQQRTAAVAAHLAGGDPAAAAREYWQGRQAQSASPSQRLAGKVCIVTGAGSPRGIGRATCLRFAQEGAAAVVATDLDETNLPSLKADIEKLTGGKTRCIVRKVDASEEADVKGIVDTAMAEFGRLDVFFANGAIVGTPTHFKDVTAAQFLRTLKINTVSVFLALKYGSAAMQVTSAAKPRASGSIIATASVAGIRSGAGSTDYSASKAAVINIVQTGAWQLGRTGVRVNALCPGLIETGMTAPTFDAARARGSVSKIGQLNPLGRYGVPDEMAAVVAFLASDDASYVNGQAYVADGGLSSSHPVVPGKLG